MSTTVKPTLQIFSTTKVDDKNGTKEKETPFRLYHDREFEIAFNNVSKS